MIDHPAIVTVMVVANGCLAILLGGIAAVGFGYIHIPTVARPDIGFFSLIFAAVCVFNIQFILRTSR